jgi:hypothetical protein
MQHVYVLFNFGYGLECPYWQNTFLLSKRSGPPVGLTQPPVYWVPAFVTGGTTAGSEFKNEWSSTSAVRLYFDAVYRENFTVCGKLMTIYLEWLVTRQITFVHFR